MEKIIDFANRKKMAVEDVLSYVKQSGLSQASPEDELSESDIKKISKTFTLLKKKDSNLNITKYTVGSDSNIVRNSPAVKSEDFIRTDTKVQNLDNLPSTSKIEDAPPEEISPPIAPPTNIELPISSKAPLTPAVAPLTEAEIFEQEKANSKDKKLKKTKKTKVKDSSDILIEDEIIITPENSDEEIKIVSSNIKMMQTSLSSGRKRAVISNAHAFQKPFQTGETIVKISGPTTVSELAKKMNLKAGKLLSQLMKIGEIVNINTTLDVDTIAILFDELPNFKLEIEQTDLEKELFQKPIEGKITKRPPIVTIMGHVDHGKTTLLDFIRKSSVAKGEAGGITQHIGAYHINYKNEVITFLDTPGHAAFTLMRARGANCTDIVILVVAADDGIMPQTLEALQHALLAKTPIIVAVSKIDKSPNSDEAIEKVKTALSAHGVVPDDWGGETQFVGVSAFTGEGVDTLLASILLQAELLDLKASISQNAMGVILETKMTTQFGIIANLLVLNGVLKQGDLIYSSGNVAKVRMMRDEHAQKISLASPAIPLEMIGFEAMPEVGAKFAVVNDLELARELAKEFSTTKANNAHQTKSDSSVDPFEVLKRDADNKSINLLIKADTTGSIEAILKLISELNEKNRHTNVVISIVSQGIGGITSGDVLLAKASKSSIIGFNVRAEKTAKDLASTEQIPISYHSIIYHLIDDLDKIINKSKAPVFKEKILGTAEVRDIFKSPKFGQIAGCMVVEGTIFKNKKIRVLRSNTVIYEGELESLRRFKDDVKEARQGLECGIGVKGYTDVKVGDNIEVFDIVEEIA